jgi:hypothetical protein
VLLRKAIGQKVNSNALVSIAKAFKWWFYKGISYKYLICILAKETGFLYELWRSNPNTIDHNQPSYLNRSTP